MALSCVFATPAMAAGPAISKKNVTLYTGKSTTLKMKNTKKKVKWSTSNKKVATVTQKGKVTAKKAGKATITAKIGKKKYTCKVTVKNPVSVKSVSLNKKSISIYKGKKYTLKATVKPSNAANKTVSWSSSNKNVAMVSSKGVVIGMGKGTATITAKSSNGKKATCKVTVKVSSSAKKASVNGITVSCNKSVVDYGYKFKADEFTVYQTYTDGSKKRSYNYTVSVSYSDGYYSAKVTCAGYSKTLKIKANNIPVSVTGITYTVDPSWVYTGEKLSDGQVKVLVKYSDGTQKYVTDFKTDFTPKTTAGTYSMTVTWGSYKGTANVTVRAKATPTPTQAPAPTATPTQTPTATPTQAPNPTATPTAAPTATPSEKKITGITASCTKDYVEYDYKLTTDDFKVYYVYSDGSTKESNDYTIEVEYPQDEMKCVATVTSAGYTKVLEINRNCLPGPATLDITGVTFSMSPTSVYVGEDLAEGQVKVTAKYKETVGTKVTEYEKNVTDFTTDFTPKDKAGTYPVKITWGEYSKTVNVTVKEKTSSATLTGISAKYSKTSIYSDETPAKDDIIVTGTYSDGSTKQITDFTYDFTPATAHKGKATITVNCSGQTLTLQVTSYVRTEPASIDAQIRKATVKVGEEFSRDNITVTATDYDGNVTTVTDYSMDFTPKSEAGTYPVTITYKQFSLNFDLKVTE